MLSGAVGRTGWQDAVVGVEWSHTQSQSLSLSLWDGRFQEQLVVTLHPPPSYLLSSSAHGPTLPRLHSARRYGRNKTMFYVEMNYILLSPYIYFRRYKYSSCEIIIWQKYYSDTAGHKSCWRSAPPPSSCRATFLYSQILTSPPRYSWAPTQGWVSL